MLVIAIASWRLSDVMALNANAGRYVTNPRYRNYSERERFPLCIVLLCEYKRNPPDLRMNTAMPRFSWIYWTYIPSTSNNKIHITFEKLHWSPICMLYTGCILPDTHLSSWVDGTLVHTKSRLRLLQLVERLYSMQKLFRTYIPRREGL